MTRRWEKPVGSSLNFEWVEYKWDVIALFMTRDEGDPSWREVIANDWNHIETQMGRFGYLEVSKQITLPNGFGFNEEALKQWGEANKKETKHKCSCDMTTLMRSGCECNGV